MSGLFGTRAGLTPDLNLLLQIVIFIVLFVGVKSAKEKTKDGLKRHGRIMEFAVVLNAVSILLAMGPSLVNNSGAVLAEFSTKGFPLTMVHALFGSVGEVLGVILAFRKFGNVRTWMRLTMSVWVIALILGFAFYFLHYVV